MPLYHIGLYVHAPVLHVPFLLKASLRIFILCIALCINIGPDLFCSFLQYFDEKAHSASYAYPPNYY